MDFGPSSCSATVSWLPCFPSVKRTSLRPILQYSVHLHRPRNLACIVSLLCKILRRAMTFFLQLGLCVVFLGSLLHNLLVGIVYKGYLLLFHPCLCHGVSRVWILILRNVVTVQTSLPISCLTVAPFSLLLLAVICARVGTVSIIRNMKYWLFIPLVAVLLLIGGYTTFPSR